MPGIKNIMELQGTLFQYGNAGMVAFEVPYNSQEQLGYIVCIGGLGDGFFPVQLVTDLADTMTVKGYNVVQVLLRSSYNMYGTASMAQDVDDIEALINSLLGRYKDENSDRLPQIVLIGYSTGSQNIITYLRDGQSRDFIRAAVVLSAVSDREYMQTLPEVQQHLLKAQEMVAAGNGSALLDRTAWHVPITAERFASLAGRLTPDDLFSSDFTDEELESLYAHITIPTLWIWGTEDEYIPKHIDKCRLGERLEWAIKCDSEFLLVDRGNHALEQCADKVVEEISAFVTKRTRMFDHHDESTSPASNTVPSPSPSTGLRPNGSGQGHSKEREDDESAADTPEAIIKKQRMG